MNNYGANNIIVRVATSDREIFLTYHVTTENGSL